MRLLRNGEIKQLLYVWTGCTIAFTAIGTFVYRGLGFYIFAVCMIMGYLYYRFTVTRYARIEELNHMLDRLLHGDETINVDEFREGELSILSSQIYKVAVRLQEQASQSMKDKELLKDALADISHQLKTPLTSIWMIVSRLQKDHIEAEKRIELAQDVIALLGRVEWLIDALLKMSKIESGTVAFNSEPVHIKQLIQKAAEPVVIAMELREQELQNNIQEDAAYMGDLAWTAEAVGNILKNCMEHTGQGGCIQVSCTDNAIYCEIVISDNGQGIPDADLPHLFERFYKGKHSHSNNVGIGLALAKAIIVRQNGTIQVKNNKGSGASFIIRFYKRNVSY